MKHVDKVILLVLLAPLLLGSCLQYISSESDSVCKESDDQGIVLEELLYMTDSFKIEEEYYSVLDELVDYLYENIEIRIEIRGHTNSIAASWYQEALSLKRAEVVYEYLLGNGISSDRMIASGFGGQLPTSQETSKEGRALKQRVEIRLLE